MFSAELPWCYFCAETKALGMTRKSMEIIFGIYKKYWQKMKTRGPTPCPRGWGARPPPRERPLSRGPTGASPTSTPTLYIPFHGQKNQRGSFIAFYNTEPPPSPNLSREGWSRVCSRLRRGESIAIIIINLPPSPFHDALRRAWVIPL